MLILASASPRRQELLKYITEDFRVISSDVDETMPMGILPKNAVEELALRKARSVSTLYELDTVIGADTIVVLGNKILGKPKNKDNAREMLLNLSGNKHLVYTGVAILAPNGGAIFSEVTEVNFAKLSIEQINAYIETGEPMDKAGAYGIQGKGALLIKGISGDFYNVMGLPIYKLSKYLSDLL